MDRMTLEQMKAIAEKRTKGEWSAHDEYVYVDDDQVDRPEDAQFIAMCGNNFDAMLKVVEIGKQGNYASLNWVQDFENALKELEKE